MSMCRSHRKTRTVRSDRCNLAAGMPVQRDLEALPTTIEMTVSLEVCIRYFRKTQGRVNGWRQRPGDMHLG
jgi:hypothetical protein